MRKKKPAPSFATVEERDRYYASEQKAAIAYLCYAAGDFVNLQFYLAILMIVCFLLVSLAIVAVPALGIYLLFFTSWKPGLY